MSDTNPKHTEWMPTNADMRGGFMAAKRIHVEAGGALDNWWVGYGKDSSCQIEGTPSHWFWLAYLMLGLVEHEDAPYSEDKPLPFSPEHVRECVNSRAALKARCAALEAKTLAFVETAEAAVRHHETRLGGGMRVPYHGPFANLPPSSVSELRRWAREFRALLSPRDGEDDESARLERIRKRMDEDDAIALAVMCPECGSPPHEDCIETHSQMRLAHCHSCRVTAAIRAKAEPK